jgi:Isochorismatase family
MVRPPPQGLSRGNRALSISKTRACARARRYAVVEPAGPAPTTATSNFSTERRLQWPSAQGGVPERPKGTGCKPVGSAYGGSNPPAPIISFASRDHGDTREPPNTAVLILDLQNGVVGGAHERDAVVAKVSSLVRKAREAEVPVVWVQHNDEDGLPQGSDHWQIVPELQPAEHGATRGKELRGLVRGHQARACCPSSESDACSWPARRPTSAFARRCTAVSFGGMTRLSSATRTQRKT